MRNLTKELVRELLTYDPDTGVFTWNRRDRKWFTSDREYKRWNTRFANEVAGCIDKSNGYIRIKILGKNYTAHQLAFLYMTGSIPEMIDHEDHDRSNNRWENIQETDVRGNSMNRSKASNNTSGVTGVYLHKTLRIWRAQIMFNRKSIHIGYFKNFDDAVSARKAAEIKYGFHENHGE